MRLYRLVLHLQKKRVFALIDDINNAAGEQLLFLNSCCGFYNLFCKNENTGRHDIVAAYGDLTVQGLFHLIYRLEQILDVVAPELNTDERRTVYV